MQSVDTKPKMKFSARITDYGKQGARLTFELLTMVPSVEQKQVLTSEGFYCVGGKHVEMMHHALTLLLAERILASDNSICCRNFVNSKSAEEYRSKMLQAIELWAPEAYVGTKQKVTRLHTYTGIPASKVTTADNKTRLEYRLFPIPGPSTDNPCLVVFQILDMDERFRSVGKEIKFVAKNGTAVMSNTHPKLWEYGHNIFLRGLNKDKDLHVSQMLFPTATEATEYIAKADAALLDCTENWKGFSSTVKLHDLGNEIWEVR